MKPYFVRIEGRPLQLDFKRTEKTESEFETTQKRISERKALVDIKKLDATALVLIRVEEYEDINKDPYFTVKVSAMISDKIKHSAPARTRPVGKKGGDEHEQRDLRAMVSEQWAEIKEVFKKYRSNNAEEFERHKEYSSKEYRGLCVYTLYGDPRRKIIENSVPEILFDERTWENEEDIVDELYRKIPRGFRVRITNRETGNTAEMAGVAVPADVDDIWDIMRDAYEFSPHAGLGKDNEFSLEKLDPDWEFRWDVEPGEEPENMTEFLNMDNDVHSSFLFDKLMKKGSADPISQTQ